MRSVPLLLLGLCACAPEEGARGERLPSESGEDAGLPVLHIPDPDAAARGERWFTDRVFGRGLFPELALRHLYLAWGVSLVQMQTYYTKPSTYWQAFGDRYGFLARAEGGDALPLGIRRTDDGLVTFDCLMCHAGGVAGQRLIGAANTRLDLQRLYDELQALPAAVKALEQQPLPEPYHSLLASVPVPDEVPAVAGMTGRTRAPGITDAMGLALALARAVHPADVQTDLGGQDPPPWWTLAFKRRAYTDGSGVVPGHRTMMAMLLGFGLTPTEYASSEADFDDVAAYLLTLRAPSWPFEAPQPTEVERGKDVFGGQCAGCHGRYDGTPFPDRVVLRDEIGTDPVRAARFGDAEAELANRMTGDAEHPMSATGGYLAPPLLGVWATAPYFHNGSVPDLASVLDPAARPAVWRRTGEGPGDFDPDRVGWRFEIGADGFDATRPGLSNAGHEHGADLSAADRAALLAYLKTL